MTLPREHGFWVMLGAVTLAALIRAELTPLVIFVMALVLGLVIAGAGLTRKLVRRRPLAQLVAAGALSLPGIPIEISGGGAVAGAVATALAWSAIFVAGALVVRGAFARARRGDQQARALDLGALFLLAGACGLFLLAGFAAQALASGITLSFMLGLVAVRPGVKQLKPVGLALAGVSALAAVVMSA